jgi:hypothetical protein
MRVALELIEGVRNGQPLSALLGYRFERAMHDAGGLDVYIQPLRDRYPVVANTVTEPPGPAESVAASGVVDGMALHAAWQSASIDWNGIGAGNPDQSRILVILSDLDDALDALGDLSLSESVFQSVRGNYERGGGLLDALSRGDRPPDPEVLRTPRGGTDYVNRLMILLTDGQARSIHWPGAANPRTVSEPRLDQWASQLLPQAQNVKARIEYRVGAVWNELEVSLADLGLGPLDGLTIADAAEQPQLAEIEQRIAYYALTTLPSSPQVDELSLIFTRDPAWTQSELSIPEFMLVARSVRGLIGGARSLLPGDLAATEDQDGSEANLDLVEFSARAAAALDRLDSLAADLETATTAPALRSALLAASLVGAPGAIPEQATGSSTPVTAALSAQAAVVSKILRDLHDKAVAADAAFDRATASPRSLLNHLNGLFGKALGRGFAACPLFTVPDPAGVTAAFGDSASLIASDPSAPARWLQQNTHVRAGVARWDDAASMAELLGGRHREPPTLAQLPHIADDRWLALPFDPAKPRPTAGRVALAAWTYGGGDLTKPAAGLLIDEWPERIPSEAETTGVSFHYDQPDSRAPQALLLAVSPGLDEVWTDDALVQILRETLDLAKVRTVDLESLTGLGQLLPAVLLPFNPDGATIAFTEYWLT